MDGIVVYQPGRVGSTNVVATLRHNGYDKTQHVHLYDEKGNPFLTGTSYKGKIEKPQYITIVRDPVARNLSSFTFGIHGHMSDYILRTKPSDKFKAEYFLKLFRHDYVLTWYATEFLKNTGISVYDKLLDREAGYWILDNLLILKAERMTEVFPEATLLFLGREIKLEQKARKFPPYFGMVKYLPEWYYEKMYDHLFTGFFYTDEEINGFYAKWKEM